MSVRRSKLFVAAFVATLALLAAAGFAAVNAHIDDSSHCQCEGG